MEIGTGDDIAETSQDSVHQSDEEVSQDLDANVTKNIDSSHSTKLCMKKKKKYIFEDCDTGVDKGVYNIEFIKEKEFMHLQLIQRLEKESSWGSWSRH